MISAMVDGNKRVHVKTEMSSEFKEADSIVDGIIAGTSEIQSLTLEMIKRFYDEIESYMSPATPDELKRVYLETTLQIVAEKINVKGYQEYLMCGI